MLAVANGDPARHETKEFVFWDILAKDLLGDFQTRSVYDSSNGAHWVHSLAIR